MKIILVGLVYVPRYVILYSLRVIVCDTYAICIRFSIICVTTLLL